jgi:hypothetical protein
VTEHDRSPAALTELSVPELMRQLSDQTATLVRQELELAKAELTVKGKRVGIGAGMFGAAGVFGLYALGAFTAAVILALSLAMQGQAGHPRVGRRARRLADRPEVGARGHGRDLRG